jgi:hypothetical protein
MSRKKVEEKQLVEEPVLEEQEPTSLDVFVEHQKKAVSSARKALFSLIPKGVKDHGRNAVEEMLEGYRQLFNDVVDDVLERVKTTQEDVNELVDKVSDEKEAASMG